MHQKDKKVLIIGGGYTGLAAAMELIKHNVPFTLIEKTGEVGGLSKTVELNGLDFELGPHIYFNKDAEVTAFWKELAGEKMKTYQRNNRIYFDGKFIKSPLSILDTLAKLGPVEIGKMLGSFAVSKFDNKPIDSAKDWVISNFGKQLYKNFFKVYNEKIWGYDTSEISPNWAGQRIKSSLTTMVMKSVKRDKDFIIKTFDFPDGGSKTIYETQFQIIKKSPLAEIKFNTTPTKISKADNGFNVNFNNDTDSHPYTDVVSTIHLSDLVDISDADLFKDKNTLQQNIGKLSYRNAIVLSMIFKREDIKSFHEHWIDIHDPEVHTLRVTNFSNYIKQEGDQVAIGIEFNCFDNDAVWNSSDEDLAAIGIKDLLKMGLTTCKQAVAFKVQRLPKAYPVYLRGYEKITQPIFEELLHVPGLHLAGRNSLFKWNNMHHSVKTGILAARNIMGATHDLMQVKGMVSIGKDSD